MMPSYEVGQNVTMPFGAWERVICALLDHPSSLQQDIGQWLADDAAHNYQDGQQKGEEYTVYGIAPDDMRVIIEQMGILLHALIEQARERVKGAQRP